MVVSSRAAVFGQKELKTNWPVEEGLIAGTTKQKATSPILKPQDGTVVLDIDSKGLR